jgi:hypothetical protein
MNEDVKKKITPESEKETKEIKDVSLEASESLQKEVTKEGSQETNDDSLESEKTRQKEVAAKEQQVNQQLEALWTTGRQQILEQQPIVAEGKGNEAKSVAAEHKTVEISESEETLKEMPSIAPVINEHVAQQNNILPENEKKSEKDAHTQVPAEYEEHELVAIKNGDKSNKG